FAQFVLPATPVLYHYSCQIPSSARNNPSTGTIGIGRLLIGARPSPCSAHGTRSSWPSPHYTRICSHICKIYPYAATTKPGTASKQVGRLMTILLFRLLSSSTRSLHLLREYVLVLAGSKTPFPATYTSTLLSSVLPSSHQLPCLQRRLFYSSTRREDSFRLPAPDFGAGRRWCIRT